MVINSKIVKIRKLHKCWGCAIKFEKGDKMEAVAFVDDGKIATFYWCEICSNYWKEYMDGESDGISQGDLAGEEHYQNFKSIFNG